jgi:hypothetical protein
MDLPVHFALCRGGDSNSYTRKGTTPSKWRVYQFHHHGNVLFFLSLIGFFASFLTVAAVGDLTGFCLNISFAHMRFLLTRQRR